MSIQNILRTINSVALGLLFVLLWAVSSAALWWAWLLDLMSSVSTAPSVRPPPLSMSLGPEPERTKTCKRGFRFGRDLFVALIVFSFPHGLPAVGDIRKRSEVQHISPLILSSSHPGLIRQTETRGREARDTQPRETLGKRKRGNLKHYRHTNTSRLQDMSCARQVVRTL